MFYRTRLARDLKRWREAGFITDAGVSGIEADLAATRSSFGAAQVFAMLGAVLFGFAIMSFVAANWEGMSKLLRLLILLVTLTACYGGAAALAARGHDIFAQAAIVGGIAVYGASIMLIAQMYHMEGNPPDAVLLWALGALATALLARSHAALASALVLGVVWSIYERMLSDGAHWGFLVFWLAAFGVALDQRWRPGLHLVAISLVIWLQPLGFFLPGEHAHWVPLAIALAAAAASSLGARTLDTLGPISGAVFVYAAGIAFSELFVLQFIDERVLPSLFEPGGIPTLIGLAVASLALLLGTMAWGIRQDDRITVWLAYAGFALEIFGLYVKTFGSLLNTSLFFLVAALIVSGLAWLAYRLHNRNLLATSPAT